MSSIETAKTPAIKRIGRCVISIVFSRHGEECHKRLLAGLPDH
jgi:hypothetical protein